MLSGDTKNGIFTTKLFMTPKKSSLETKKVEEAVSHLQLSTHQSFFETEISLDDFFQSVDLIK